MEFGGSVPRYLSSAEARWTAVSFLTIFAWQGVFGDVCCATHSVRVSRNAASDLDQVTISRSASERFLAAPRKTLRQTHISSERVKNVRRARNSR